MGGVSFRSGVFSARVRWVTNRKATPPSLVYTPLEATSSRPVHILSGVEEGLHYLAMPLKAA
jgi:hypothetical protein